MGSEAGQTATRCGLRAVVFLSAPNLQPGFLTGIFEFDYTPVSVVLPGLSMGLGPVLHKRNHRNRQVVVVTVGRSESQCLYPTAQL